MACYFTSRVRMGVLPLLSPLSFLLLVLLSLGVFSPAGSFIAFLPFSFSSRSMLLGSVLRGFIFC
jgi:hypothetical protein